MFARHVDTELHLASADGRLVDLTTVENELSAVNNTAEHKWARRFAVVVKMNLGQKERRNLRHGRTGCRVPCRSREAVQYDS